MVVRLAIAQGLDRGGEPRLLHLQPRVGTEARGSLGGRLQESRPDARQAEEPQRVPGRRGVEQHVVERHGRLVARKKLSELVERRDLDGARASELLAQLGDLVFGPDGPIGGDHALAVLVGRLLGIDVERRRARPRPGPGWVAERAEPRASRPGSTPGRC